MHFWQSLLTLGVEMFELGDFWLQTRVIIKILTHPWHPSSFGWILWGWSKKNTGHFHIKDLRIGHFEKKICFIPIKISQRYLGTKDVSKFWWLPWFLAKNHPTQTFLPPVHYVWGCHAMPVIYIVGLEINFCKTGNYILCNCNFPRDGATAHFSTKCSSASKSC